MKVKNTLYKKDKNGNTRVWWAEYDETGYVTKSGVKGGSIVSSGKVLVEEKNVGKANATSLAEQVIAELESMYRYQLLQGKYHEDESTIEDGASFVECMLAATYDAKKHNQFPYALQPKLDGCVSGDSLVTTELGERTVKEVFEGPDTHILSFDTRTEKCEFKPITGKHKEGKDIRVDSPYKWKLVTLSSGKQIKMTDNHRIYLPELDVWRELSEIEVGDLVLIK